MAILKMGERTISNEGPAFVIAEIGHNHQGNLGVALNMIKTAATCGVSAVKFQKRDNKHLYTKAMYNRPYDNENSFGTTYGEHREFLEFDFDEYKQLKKCAEDNGVEFLCTAFDIPSVDFLEKLGVNGYKVASGDLMNIPMLEYIAKLGKPMLVSTGAGTMNEAKMAYAAIKKYNDQLCFLHAISSYPAEYEDLNLNVISTLQNEFPDIIVGYSGHDNGILAASIAYMLGARVIEKHFTINRAWKGTDHKFSLEPDGMRKQVRDLNRIESALGENERKVFPIEKDYRAKQGKSIFAAKNLAAGTVLKEDDIVIKSPGGGMEPYRLNEVIGKKLNLSINEEEMIKPEQLAGGSHDNHEMAPSMNDIVKGLRLIVFDFDGIFTDNRVITMQNGIEGVACWRSDGLGLDALKETGTSILVLSTEENSVVSARCRKLGIECIQGYRDKAIVLKEELGKRGLTPGEIAYVGNDINDIECLKIAGLPMTVADAYSELKPYVKYTTKKPGGYGAVREICDMIAGIKNL